jgi:5-hydroxyisourate hydrolase
LRFDVGAYFRDSERECFYDDVVVSFHIDGTGHYHVPLILSPFGYTTYRGS